MASTPQGIMGFMILSMIVMVGLALVSIHYRNKYEKLKEKNMCDPTARRLAYLKEQEAKEEQEER